MNFNPLFEGIGFGLSLSVLIGPSFFTLIQTSIYRGFTAGMVLAFGIFVSDITLVILSYFGLSQIMGNENNQLLLGLIGGVLLIIFGVVTFYRKPHPEKIECNNGLQQKIKQPGISTYFLKGYFLNIANPFLIFFWMSIVIFVNSNYGTDKSDTFLFFTTMLGVVLITDFIKCFVANKLKAYLKPPIMLWLNRIVGVLLVVFGFILIFRVMYEFY